MSAMTVPNWISVLRAILAVPIVIVFHRHPTVALAVFVIAALLDWVDGTIARSFNAKSELGATLDPLADKILYMVALAVLMFEYHSLLLFYVWLISGAAETGLMLTRLPSFKKYLGSTAAATLVGKLKMCVQCAAVILLMSGVAFSMPILVKPGMTFVVIGALFSCWSLVIRCKKTAAS